MSDSGNSSSDGEKRQLQLYFCASIRGELVSKPFLGKLIDHLRTNHGPVLTEHIAFDVCEKPDMTDRGIYERDVAWLKASDLVIAECSSASLGVGYELAYAESLGKPILVLYRWPRPDGKKLSAMIAGSTYERLAVRMYETEEDVKRLMDEWIAEWKKGEGRS